MREKYSPMRQKYSPVHKKYSPLGTSSEGTALTCRSSTLSSSSQSISFFRGIQSAIKKDSARRFGGGDKPAAANSPGKAPQKGLPPGLRDEMWPSVLHALEALPDEP